MISWSLFRSSRLRRVLVDYYFYVGATVQAGLTGAWASSSNCALVLSSSLSIVSWGLFGFLYSVLGSACALSCVRFGMFYVVIIFIS